MYPIICHIYGPFYLHSYSIMLALGIFTFIFFASKHAKQLAINRTFFINLMLESSLAGIVGGRLLHVLSDLSHYQSLYDVLRIWEGGLSVLGSIIGVTVYATWYCTYYAIPLLRAADIGALYAPLIHAIARIGCFLAGCCYGTPTQLPWAVTYTNDYCSAPLHIPLHPTQLYSSLIFLAIFVVLQLIARRNLKPGELLGAYFILSSLERLLVDFYRNDRIFNSITYALTNNWLSFHQLVSIGIASGGLLLLVSIRLLRLRTLYSSVNA